MSSAQSNKSSMQDDIYKIKLPQFEGPFDLLLFFIERDELDTYINFFETLNSCKSLSENYTEVINSLYDITPCKKYLFSWEELNPTSEYVDTKSILKEKIGMWTTQDDLYKETNGEHGFKLDFHWDYRTEKSFFEFIKNKIEQ